MLTTRKLYRFWYAAMASKRAAGFLARGYNGMAARWAFDAKIYLRIARY